MANLKSKTGAFAAICLAGTSLSLVSFALADARGRMGGGGRGTSMSVNRGGGGGMSRGGGGMSRGGSSMSRGGGNRGGDFNRPSNRPSGGYNRPGGGGAGTRDINRNNNANRNNNFNRNTNINHNTNINRNVNVDVDRDWNRYGYGGYHPVARGIAFGTAAAVTAAAVGSMIYTLPPSCVTWTYYYRCGSVWYQPQYAGTSVTYVVVNQPAGYQ